MRQKFNKLSLRYLRNFIVLIIVPVVLFGVFINYYYNEYFLDQSELQMGETVSLMANNLNDEIRNVSILTSVLVHNNAFIETSLLYNNSDNPQDDYYLSEELDHQISNMFLYTNKIGTIYAFFKDKPVYVFRNYPIVNALPESPQIEDIFFGDSRFPNIVNIDKDLFSLYKSTDQQRQEPLLVLSIIPDYFEYEGQLNALVFAFQLPLFKQIQEDDSREFFSFITDGDDNLILQSRHNTLGSGILQSLISGDGKTIDVDQWLITKEVVPFTAWNIYYVADKKVISEPFAKINKIFYGILGILILLFIWYTILFFHNMLTPVNSLIGKMMLVEQGDYTVRAQAAGPDEIYHLITSFNRMVSRVQQLTEEKELNEREKSALELEALQYQINPHFIANTLNSIRLMAVVNKDDHIKDMTASLMRLINDSFRSDGSCTTLQQDIKNVEGYVHIMKVRFGNRIELISTVPPELQNRKILKMLIQPLVENSVVHGLNDKKGKGIIEIGASLDKGERNEEILMVTIKDNGKGFLTSRQELPSPLKDQMPHGFSGLGVKNVDRRIQLNYGETYGLSIESSPGEYTLVRLRLPSIE